MLSLQEKLFNRNAAFKAVVLIILLTTLVYANALKNSFVFDDYLIIVENNFVKSWKNFPLIFNKAYLATPQDMNSAVLDSGGSGEVTYRPVVTATYFADYSLWGLNAFGYHLTNLLLHIFNAALLYFLVNLLIKSRKAALLVSLLFALHPVNSAAVNVISFREDLLAFLFYASSFILYIKVSSHCGVKKALVYSLSLALFLLALFSKEMAVTLPLLLILYDYLFAFREDSKIYPGRFKRYAGYFMVLLFYFLVWGFYFKSNLNLRAHLSAHHQTGIDLYRNLLMLLNSVSIYFQWLVFPFNIHTILMRKSFPVAYSGLRLLFKPAILLSLSLIIALFAAAFKMRKTAKEKSFAILWFFVALLPVCNIYMVASAAAGRYLYVPSAGFCLLLALFLLGLGGMRSRYISEDFLKKFKIYAVIILLLFYSAFTMIRSLSWRNNVVFWRELAQNYPGSAMVHSNLGICLAHLGFMEEGIEECKVAVSLDGRNATNHLRLCYAYFYNMMPEKAIIACREAIKLDPRLIKGYFFIGEALAATGAYEEAIDYFKQAIKAEPRAVVFYAELGNLYYKLGKFKQARQAWEAGLKIDPACQRIKYRLKALNR